MRLDDRVYFNVLLHLNLVGKQVKMFEAKISIEEVRHHHYTVCCAYTFTDKETKL